MPYSRPGYVSYHVATKQVTHGNPCIEDGIPGVAIKQQEQSWTLGIASRNVIAVSESFAILDKGVVQIPASLLGGATKGMAVYIATADNTLSNTAGGGKVKFGVVDSLAGDNRGTPTGFIRVNLDMRNTL